MNDARVNRIKAEDAITITLIILCTDIESKWRTIQQRTKPGSFGAKNNESTYRQGFGKLKDNYWIGLDKIYNLTRNNPMKLRLYYETTDGSIGVAFYNKFYIGDESSNFALYFDSYSHGNAGNSLGNRSEFLFTSERINNTVYYQGWWHDFRSDSTFNARYYREPVNNIDNGIFIRYRSFTDDMAVRVSMSIK